MEDDYETNSFARYESDPVIQLPAEGCPEETGIYEDAGALYEAWVSGNCVPDYITAIISTDGGTDNLTFGLVEGKDGERGRQEILDLVRDDA